MNNNYIAEKKRYNNKVDTLKRLFNSIKKSSSKKNIFTLFRIIGPILFVLGFLYLFGGLHPDEWEQNQLLKYFPSMNKYLIIPITFVWQKIDSVVQIGVNGKFGVQLIAIAFILIYISIPAKNEMCSLKSLYTVSKIILVVIIIWHWLMQLIEDNGIFDGMIYYIIIFTICFAFGKIIGTIFQKIVKL